MDFDEMQAMVDAYNLGKDIAQAGLKVGAEFKGALEIAESCDAEEDSLIFNSIVAGVMSVYEGYEVWIDTDNTIAEIIEKEIVKE